MSQASICWLSADPHLPIGIQCHGFLYKVYPVLFTSFFTCSGANYPSSSPAPPFVTVRTRLSDIPCFLKQTPFILNHVVIKNINDNSNNATLCFCSVYLKGGYSCFLPSFYPEQNRTANPNCMLSVNYFEDSGPDRTNIILCSFNLYLCFLLFPGVLCLHIGLIEDCYYETKCIKTLILGTRHNSVDGFWVPAQKGIFGWI